MEESSPASKVIAGYFCANANAASNDVCCIISGPVSVSGRCSMLFFFILRRQLMHHDHVKHHPHAVHLTSPPPALRTLIPHDL